MAFATSESQLQGPPLSHQHQQHGVEYTPLDSGKLSIEEENKLESFFSFLKQRRDNAPSALGLQSKMPDSKVRELAVSLLDGTVFEITKELEEIQQLNERSLLNRRMRTVNSNKMQKMQMTKQHKQELASHKHRPHHLPVLQAQHKKEMAELEQKLADEMRSVDQKIILELDQIVTEQQSTMQQAAVPFFTAVTNNPSDIQTQMHVLESIQKLVTSTLQENTSSSSSSSCTHTSIV